MYGTAVTVFMQDNALTNRDKETNGERLGILEITSAFHGSYAWELATAAT